MNSRTLGDRFVETRKERNLSETRNFQEFRNQRNILDVTDGNRRVKKYTKAEHMKGLIEHQFGRKGRSVSNHSSHSDISALAQMYHTDNQFYSK